MSDGTIVDNAETLRLSEMTKGDDSSLGTYYVLPRKPISVCTTEERYVVICDDGSIWKIHHGGKKWERLPDIPQDTKDE